MRRNTVMNPTSRKLRSRKLAQWSDALMTVFAFLFAVILIFVFSIILEPFNPDLLIWMSIADVIILIIAIILGKAAKHERKSI